MRLFEGVGRPGEYEPPVSNRYEYRDFRAETWPEGELLARRVQAKSYQASGFVRPEGLVCENGVEVLAADIARPSDVPPEVESGAWTEYSIGREKDDADWDPETGKLVAWKKYHAPLDALPTYRFCRDNLWDGWSEYLRAVDADPARELAEPEGLGKTSDDPGVIKEFMRNEIQRAQGKGEVWFMGLVETTVFGSWLHYWGPRAVRKIGDPKPLVHPHVEDVRLVPTVMDIDRFYVDFYSYLRSLGDKLTLKQLADFVYMADGISDTALGAEVADFRTKARQIIGMLGDTSE